MKRNGNLILLVLCILLLPGLSKYTGIRLEAVVDDVLTNVAINGVEWRPNSATGVPINYLYVFKGYPGHTIVIQLWNNSLLYYLAALLTIGTKQFSTNNPAQWKVSDLKATPLTTSSVINGVNVFSIGRVDNTPDLVNFYVTYLFEVPNELYCTNYDMDSLEAPNSVVLPATYYFPIGLNKMFNLPDLIYFPFVTGEVAKFTLANVLTIADLSLGGNLVVQGTKYEVLPLSIIGKSYGKETINYSVTTTIGQDIATSCKVDIVICHQLCAKCDPNQLTNDNNHQCITCTSGYQLTNINPPANCQVQCGDKWYVDTSLNIHCVTSCPNGYPYEILPTHECISKCLPLNDKYDSQLSQCVEDCPDKWFKDTSNNNNIICVSACPPGYPFEIGKTGQCVSECLYPNDNYSEQDHCLSACPGKWYVNSHDEKRCVTSCPNGYDLLIIATLECISQCLSPNVIFYQGECISNCPDKWYVNSSTNSILCVTECPNGYPLIITATNECISKCLYPNDKYSQGECISACPDKWYVDTNLIFHCVMACPKCFLYEIVETHQCVAKCLPPYAVNSMDQCIFACPPNSSEYNGKCYDKCFPVSLLNDDSLVYVPYTAEECISTINELILYYLSIGKNVEGKDFLLQVYTTVQIISSVRPISSIDLSQCIEQLRSSDINLQGTYLIIAKYDLINIDSAINQVEYNIYNEAGKLLDLSVCRGIQGQINYPIKEYNVDLDKLKYLGELGINAYNTKDPFFNNQCFPFHYKSLSQNSNEDADVVLSDRRIHFLSKIPVCESNCLYINITHSTRRSNCLCHIKPSISTSLYPNAVISQSFPDVIPKSNLGIAKCYHLLLIFDKLRGNMGFWLHGVIFFLQIFCIVMYSLEGLKIIYPALNESSSKHLKKRKVKQNFHAVISLKSDQLNDFQNLASEATDNMQNSKEFSIINERSNNDHIAFLRMFHIILSRYIPIARLFKPLSKFEIESLYSSYLLLHLSLISAFNALLLQDKLISMNYTSTFSYGYIALNAFICSVASWIVTRLLRFLIFYHHRLEKEAFTDETTVGFYTKLRQVIRRSSFMIIVYLHLTVILSIASWYYVSLFCIIYEKTQVTFVYGITMTLGFSSVVLFMMMAFLCSLIKKSAYKLRSFPCYSFAKLLLDYCL